MVSVRESSTKFPHPSTGYPLKTTVASPALISAGVGV